jgi:hypothetical protein
MKVLLDECLPIDFRHHIAGHEVHTAQFAGFKGLENSKLLSEAEAAGYELFLTVDQGIRGEQNLAGRRISVLIIRGRTNQMEDLIPLAGRVLEAIALIRPGQVSIVG